MAPKRYCVRVRQDYTGSVYTTYEVSAKDRENAIEKALDLHDSEMEVNGIEPGDDIELGEATVSECDQV